MTPTRLKELWRKAHVPFQPVRSSYVVPGARDDWLKKCSEVLDAAPQFSLLKVSERPPQLDATYRVPPVTGQLTVSLSAEGGAATRVSATVTVAPNIFTFFSTPELTILARFSQGIGVGHETAVLS
jgi:hypothetical protein